MLQIILIQDFCPLKIKITQCLRGFRLNYKQTLLTPLLIYQFLATMSSSAKSHTYHCIARPLISVVCFPYVELLKMRITNLFFKKEGQTVH